MGYTPYRTMVLIPDGHSLTFLDLVGRLQNKFSGQSGFDVQVNTSGVIAVGRNGWSLRVYWEDQPHVVIESREIAERFVTDDTDRAIVAACRSRITTAGDPDPGMDHFNDYVYVLEILEEISDAFIFDPEGGEIRKTGR